MNREDELLHMHLLGNITQSTSQLKPLYKVLLNYLQANDFKAFKNLLDNSQRKYERFIDMNHVHEVNQIGMTYLDIACQNDQADFVAYLLAQGSDPNKINEEKKRGPIHFATEKGSTNILKILFNETTINPNLEASGQLTALHLAVKRNDLECTELLLDKGAQPNIPNNKGLTPIHMAAMKGQENMVKLIFEKSKLSIDLDSFKDYNHQTTRQVLQKKLPNMTLSPFQEKTEVDIHDLRYYLNANDQANFLNTFPKVTSLSTDMIMELLEIAVRRNFCKSVSVLLDQKNKEDCDDLAEVARIAVQKGYKEILKKLIQLDASLADSLIMDACVELGMPETCIDKNLLSNRLQCLKLILMEDNVNLRREDVKGNTPLHYVARSGCQEAIELLLERGCYIGHMNKFNTPPIADIPPGILSKYLDNCLRMKKDETNKYVIEFDYRCLMPHDTAVTSSIDEEDDEKSLNRFRSSETETLRYIADHNGLKHFLKHPLFSSFLYLKWHRMRHYFYINLLFCVIFYLLINAYIFVTANDDDLIAGGNYILYTATCIALICLAFREILQFLSTPFYYMFSFGNWLDIVLISLSTLFLLGIVPQIRAVIILLSTWQVILSIGDHPKMSTGIEMFKRVSWTFIKFLFPYVICIVAFAFAFGILFESDDNFKTFGLSLFKTIIMLTGEFDAGDLPFTILGRCIFVIFVFFMAIILLNLLNGLAVSDTAEVLKKAELVSLMSRTKLIAYVENIAMGAPRVRDPPRLCCINFSILNLGFNPLYFLVKRILLFPSYLQDGQLCVPLYNNSKVLDRNKVNMDEQIVKQVRDLLFRKDQENDSNERLYNRLASIESNIDTIKHVIRNNNRNVSNDQGTN